MKYILVSFAIFLTSCQRDIDLSNLDSFIDYSIKYIEKGDVNAFLDLTDIDTMRVITGKIRNTNKKIFSSQLSEHNRIEVIKYEIMSIPKRDIYGRVVKSSKSTTSIEYYLIMDQSYYLIEAAVSKRNDAFYYSSVNLKNLSKNCHYDLNNNYVPIMFRLDRGYWLASNDRKSFKELTLRGVNNTRLQIDQIQFKLKLNKINGDEFFSKTITKDVTIEPDDTFQFRINELDDYFVGFELTNETFRFTTDVISVLPKPRSLSCLKIEELANDE
ncbi:hypothetical protein [uncultured Winogradskyella sp.]|uniref:hypothetical protein n=1 Tax=uncultured Winogradskyella sp. TaxID=395353 RepID=UPI00262523B6|nr:hypothetical protein [uncultured Winogradskyella sp.]